METLVKQDNGSLIDNLCRKLLFSILQTMDDGYIKVYDQKGEFEFGNPEAELRAIFEVHDHRTYSRVVTGGTIGAAESYVLGQWGCDDLLAVTRIFCRNQRMQMELENKLAWITFPYNKIKHWLNRNTLSGSKDNISAHYDLGNDLYELFLDPHMQYSSAVFKHSEQTLEEAQENKLEVICQKLDLQPEDHVIEIGTGWAGLACYMAKHYGCKVTTTTLSEEQYAFAQESVRRQGLEDKVTLLLQDYRDLQGQYDKLVSVEMIEAVGHQYMPRYFEKLEQLLKPNGRMLIQAITIADQAYDNYRRGVDFIQKYIFPGGCLPSLFEMCKHLQQKTSMTVSQVQEYGIDYADTLAVWTQRFNNAAHKLEELGYDASFRKMWNYYFAYCEGGFREGCINLIHFEAVKPGTRQNPGFGYS